MTSQTDSPLPLTRFCQLCAQMEGFGRSGAIPTIRHNPMDLKHGPNAMHPVGEPDCIGYYASDELGWQDAERQAELWASRALTLAEAIQKQTGWTPDGGDVEGNDTAAYLAFVLEGFAGVSAVSAETPMTDVLKISAMLG